MSKEQAISELEAVINKVWSRTKTTSPLLEAIYKWHEEESNKAVIEELERQNKHYLSKGGHLLLYDDENGNPVYLSERLEALKEEIGEVSDDKE